MKIILLVILFPLFAFSSEEIDTTALLEEYRLRPKFGLYSHYNLNYHFTDFSGLGNTNCCPGFDYGSGYSFSLGALAEMPLEKYFKTSFSKKSEISLRFGYSGYDGELLRTETEDIIVDGVSRLGEFTHLFNFNYGTIGIEPALIYKVMPDLRLYGGFRLALNTYNHYYQIERITDPPDRGTFVNGFTTRNEDDGEIQNVQQFQYALIFGAGYEFPLNTRGSLFIQPESFYTLNLSPIIKDNSWLTHNIRFGVSLKYKQPLPPPPKPDPPLSPPLPGVPFPSELPDAFVDINAVQVDSTGKRNDNFNIKVEDFVSLNMRPLLNYVFFDDSSSVLPPRYNMLSKSQTSDFNLDNLQGLDALETYYHVLNIIGMRMRMMPDTKVNLIGNNSNSGAEKGNIELSKDRAESVKNYLVNIWEIKPERISVTARNLPKQPTRQDEPEGVEENRRVEIIPDDWKLVESVVTTDTMRVVSNSKIEFIPEMNSSVGIKNWNFKANLKNSTVFEKRGYEPPEKKYQWEITNKSKLPLESGNIEYQLFATDSLGQTFNSKLKNIPVEQLTVDRKRLERIDDKEFEYYSLILFDFGTTNLGSQHRSVVDIVKNRISEKAKVYIYGYSDRLGDEEINERISNQRARSVARRMNIPGAVVEGKGESELLYNNDLPEGRFYCRTVQIIIETPVE
jgi:outer membrane protein OmpA-like peptidoglycan-associated protein